MEGIAELLLIIKGFLRMLKIKKGLDLPINGVPSQKIVNAKAVSTVAITGFDYVGMKPTMLVQEGDKVKTGQPVFECKKTPGVIYTAPAAGTVKAINRGEKRVFQTMVIEVESDEHQSFSSWSQKDVSDFSGEEIRSLLIESGMWTGFRTRPFSRVPAVDHQPSAIFVTAVDTNPLCADPEVVINEYPEDFKRGLELLGRLTDKEVFVVKKNGADIPTPSSENIKVEEVSGPHPAGNVGTHIHFLSPVGPKNMVWYMDYQDVIAVGRLFLTGKLFLERVVAVGGPKVYQPRLLRTRVGADINTLLDGQLKDGEVRIISGSIWNGRQRCDVFHYLGRYNNQVTCMEENRTREFLGWQGPGTDKYSIKNTFAGKFKNKSFDFTTKVHGSPRAMVPVGSFEKVMPMDILPTQLLRALVTRDTDLAQQLGCLELDEEDLALCTFASPGKEDFGPYLRDCLTIIEKEG